MVPPVRLRLALTTTVAVGVLAGGTPALAAAPDPEIAALQVSLRSKGLYFGKIDGVSGAMTAKGLRTFQRLVRLPVDGKLGPRTRARLGALGRPLVARRVLVQGTYGWDVSTLQFELARAGHLRLLEVDGHFGASTKAALTRFQRSRGLAVDGIFGPATLTAFGYGNQTPVLARVTRSTISYTVRPGDTLAQIAARHSTSVSALAKANDIDSPNLVVIGDTLRLPGTASPTASSPAAELSRSTVRGLLDKWASRYGIPISLARALAWQESGFQVNVTSKTGAWGPMQVMPETWEFVETILLGGRRVPRTAEGGIEVGMTLLSHLLKRFEGSQRLALGAWYQGEKAVREHGLFKETKTFVANVLALTGRPL
jgi:peptidoglycan hydrolase-like protein with peptidoglycan-binding domain